MCFVVYAALKLVKEFITVNHQSWKIRALVADTFKYDTVGLPLFFF